MEYAEDADEMLEMALNKLPKTLEEHYQSIIDRIKQKDRGKTILPLWK
jgi:hypothetical protein